MRRQIHMARYMNSRTFCGREIVKVLCAGRGCTITCKTCQRGYGASRRT